MKVINPNKKINSDPKIINNNIYSKIAPPNTFKRRNPNQILRGSKMYKNYDKSPRINQIINPYKNSSNEMKNSFLSKSINNNIIKGKFFLNKNNINNIDNSHKAIITPKKILFGTIKVKNSNKVDFNKYKTERQNISSAKVNIANSYKNKYIKLKEDNINNDNNKDNSNIIVKKHLNYENNSIKERYNFLLEKTKNLLNNYQKIIEYYQQKEKNG